ncbi:hypothetical protein [Azotobacter vinelandii]|nr:hypothetical protein [Azotobacter vinelandii]WKN23138.1 hypothetical protein AVAEIV_001171 [Azotobacter vinelandii]
MAYSFSALLYFMNGKLTWQHLLYALRVRPIAVASKGKTWVIDPGFEPR